MNTHQITYLFIIFVIYSCTSRNQVSQNKEQENIFIYDKIDTFSVSGLSLNEQIDKCIRIFGSPDSVYMGYNEFENDSTKILLYKKSEFMFRTNKFSQFEIKDSNFVINPYDISVGKDIAFLNNLFPVSYKNIYKIDSNLSALKLDNNNGAYLIFIINEKNRISQILYWFSY
jgi:hypothetical protein